MIRERDDEVIFVSQYSRKTHVSCRFLSSNILYIMYRLNVRSAANSKSLNIKYNHWSFEENPSKYVLTKIQHVMARLSKIKGRTNPIGFILLEQKTITRTALVIKLMGRIKSLRL